MKRDLYSACLNWKKSKTRKPLIIRGARQVGKTYLLKEFGKNEYSNFVYLNFEEDPKLNDLFSNVLKPAIILENIKIYMNVDIEPESTLLIFDEIQESPSALNSLKYFQEQVTPFHIAAAGSLLGIKLANTKGFPVGKVSFLDLYPLSFMEFLTALNKAKLRDLLTKTAQFSEIPNPIHSELINLLKKYIIVGGMPEAVVQFIKDENLSSVRQIQHEILDGYLLDFAKHAPKADILKITQVWQSIPSQLAKENKKFVFSALRKSARGREYESAIQWLADAGLIHKSYNISTPKIPLSGFANNHAFKVFLLDVGLLSTMSQLPIKLMVEEFQMFSEFNGALTENFVAQELTANQTNLYYWTSEGIAEVDFIVQKDTSLMPLEVKAGVSRKKKSLLVYAAKYKSKYLLRSSLMNLKKDGEIYNIPLYLIGRFKQFFK